MGEDENRVRGRGVGGERGESNGNKRKEHIERLCREGGGRLRSLSVLSVCSEAVLIISLTKTWGTIFIKARWVKLGLLK